jgi:hypothetical protein
VVFITLVISICSAQTDKRNVVKVFPTSVLFGKATIGYERVINENGSFTFVLGLPTGTNSLKFEPKGFSEEFNAISGNLKGLVLMPGYRFNLSRKGAPLGFFVEPYLKYEKFDLDFHADFIDDENDHFLGNIDGNYSGLGAGIQMGVLCLIADVVSLELSFLGFEAKVANADLTWTDESDEVDLDDVYDELESDFADIPLIGDKVEYEQGDSYVNANISKFILPGFRFAFSVGIAF